MVVAEGQRAEAAEEVEDRAAVLVDVVHAFGALDLDLVEAEQLHEMQLARIDMRLEQIGHRATSSALASSTVSRFGLADGGRGEARRFDDGAGGGSSSAGLS